VGVGHHRRDGGLAREGHAGMYWWLLVEFICIYCGSVDNMQFLKFLT